MSQMITYSIKIEISIQFPIKNIMSISNIYLFIYFSIEVSHHSKNMELF